MNYLLSLSEFVFAGVRISLIIKKVIDVAPILDSGTQRKVIESKII